MLPRRPNRLLSLVWLCVSLGALFPLESAGAESHRVRVSSSKAGIIVSPIVPDGAITTLGIAVILPDVSLDLGDIPDRFSYVKLRRAHRELNRQSEYGRLRKLLSESQRQHRLTDWHAIRLTSAWAERHIRRNTRRAVVLYCLLFDQGWDVAMHEPRGSRASPTLLVRTVQTLQLPGHSVQRSGGPQHYYPILKTPFPKTLHRGNLRAGMLKSWWPRRALDLFDDLGRFVSHGDRTERIATREIRLPWEGRTAVVKLDYLVPYASYLAYLPPLSDETLHAHLRSLTRPSKSLATSVKRELRLYTKRNDVGEQVRFLMSIAQRIDGESTDLPRDHREATPAAELSLARRGRLEPIERALLFISMASSVGLDTALVVPDHGPMAGVALNASGGLRYGDYIAVDTTTPGLALGEVAELRQRMDATVTPINVRSSPL